VNEAAKGKPGNAGASDSDTPVGFYGHAGVAFVLARHVHFGAEYRLVRGAGTNLNGVHGDANNEQASAFVGYSW
jgi:opacity protein-like surface antigen